MTIFQRKTTAMMTTTVMMMATVVTVMKMLIMKTAADERGGDKRDKRSRDHWTAIFPIGPMPAQITNDHVDLLSPLRLNK